MNFPITLTQLTYFCTVVHSKSVHEAADKLHISQPSLSVALKTIERLAGVPLFTRDNRKLVLTDEGRIFYQEASLLLTHAEGFHDRLQRLQHRQQKIKLGIAPMMSSFLIPLIFSDFKKEMPHIEFEVYESGVLRLQSLLNKQELDLAFLIHNESVSEMDVSFHELLNTEYFLYTGENSDLAHAYRESDQPTLSFSEYMHTPMIFYRETSYIQTRLIAHFQAHHAMPHILLRTNQIHTIKQLVRMSIASAFLTEKAVTPADKLLRIPLSETFPITIGIAHNNQSPMTPSVRDFIEFLHNHKDVL